MPETALNSYRPKGGPTPARRLPLSRPFWNRLRFGAEPAALLSQYAGFRHHSNFSAFLSSGVIRATPTIVGRFERLAQTLGWTEPIFEPEVQR
jgi:hypothetical protein